MKSPPHYWRKSHTIIKRGRKTSGNHSRGPEIQAIKADSLLLAQVRQTDRTRRTTQKTDAAETTPILKTVEKKHKLNKDVPKAWMINAAR